MRVVRKVVSTCLCSRCFPQAAPSSSEEEEEECETCGAIIVGEPNLLAYGSVSVQLCSICYANEAPGVIADSDSDSESDNDSESEQAYCFKCDSHFSIDCDGGDWGPHEIWVCEDCLPCCIKCRKKLYSADDQCCGIGREDIPVDGKLWSQWTRAYSLRASSRGIPELRVISGADDLRGAQLPLGKNDALLDTKFTFIKFDFVDDDGNFSPPLYEDGLLQSKYRSGAVNMMDEYGRLKNAATSTIGIGCDLDFELDEAGDESHYILSGNIIFHNVSLNQLIQNGIIEFDVGFNRYIPCVVWDNVSLETPEFPLFPFISHGQARLSCQESCESSQESCESCIVVRKVV